MTNDQRLQQFTDFIKSDDQNFTFVKFGDGEFLCIMGTGGANCDMHPYSRALADKLIDAFVYLASLPNCYIAKWESGYEDQFKFLRSLIPSEPQWVYYNLILQQTFNLNQYLYNFYYAIKQSKRKKIFVSNDTLHEVNSFLNVDHHVSVPIINSFSNFDSILNEASKHVCDNAIFIFSAGMPAKPLIKELLTINPNMTCIDAGSAFDPIFKHQTRLNQPDKGTLQYFYMDMLTKN